MNIESRWRLLAFWSAKDVPQVHWRRIQVMLMKIQASKPKNRCCTGVVQQDQSTGGQTSRLEVSQELCAQVAQASVDCLHRAVDWVSSREFWLSTGAQTSRLVQ